MGSRASSCIWPYADIQHGFLDRELGFDHLHALAAQGRHGDVRRLLRQGMDPNARREEGAFGADEDERGDSPMICTARGILGNKGRKRHVKTLEVLLHFGARVNQTNVLNHTALYVACERDLPLVASWLLQHGADVNIACKTGTTPLMCSYRNKNASLVTQLLAHGAVVMRPPVHFSRIHFPELSDELAGELSSREEPRRDSTASSLRAQLQEQIDKEAARRAKVVEDAEEAQRLEDQRVYREQLAKEGSKRKARRRRRREESQRRRQLPAVPALAASEREEDTPRLAPQRREPLLVWEKQPASSSRPRWVARETHTTQQAAERALDPGACRAALQMELLRQCEQIHRSLELERHRRRQTVTRALASAPSSSGLDELEGLESAAASAARFARPSTSPV